MSFEEFLADRYLVDVDLKNNLVFNDSVIPNTPMPMLQDQISTLERRRRYGLTTKSKIEIRRGR